MNPNTTVILIRSCRLLLLIPDVRRCGSTVYKQHRCCPTHLISGILTIADSVDLRSSSSSIDDDDIDDDDDDDDCAVDGGGNCNGNGNGNGNGGVLVIR